MADQPDPAYLQQMKSGRNYVPKPKMPLADGTATDYTAGQLSDLRESFQPCAMAQKRTQKFLVLTIYVVLISLVAFAVLPLPYRAVAFCTFFAGLAGIIVVNWMGPKLNCPGCGQHLERPLGEFCPECGHHGGVDSGKMFAAARCSICGMRLLYRKGHRHFKIRACTHCGLPLDEEGV